MSAERAAEDAGLRARWRDLVDRRLPAAAAARPDWPVRLDHCFARILLDNACGGPWRESVAPPAWVNMPSERLARAFDLGEAVLAGAADLGALNRRSLAWRGKERVAAAPASLSGADFALRRWRRADDAPFAAMNADPAVRRYFPGLKTESESIAEARALDRRFAEDGFGPWALDLPGEGFRGFVGGWRVARPMPFAAPGERVVEVGWRLAPSAWGRGLATRAARLALADLFGRCGLSEVVAYTAADNAPSRAVMVRLGMRHDAAADFDHPVLPAGHALRPHVLYRLAAADFAR
jgi:RimJ/RimL family protein N-acetyltransferase